MTDLSQQNIDRFNDLAAEWDTNPRRAATAKAVADAIRQIVPLTGTEQAFEFGCGTGMVTLAVAPHVGHMLAMDSSSEMLASLHDKINRSSTANIETLEGDLADTPPKGRFDLILSSMTLHHIADTKSLLHVLFKLLQPGGRIALADLDREDGSFHGDKPGIAHHGFDREELTDWLAAAGFVDCCFSTVHQMEKEMDDGTTRRFPIFLVRASRPE
ncbi:MAG: class I SAM-dependent methyltransferase [Salinisphaera sp.]|jgi:ubiquinone/menaquinone biosynthesis C-methylase UbiE|nr:class I SAM-dependent methyltransferase [Salinisphaera sp.]